MSYKRYETYNNRAKRNIRRGNGWMCPNCESYMPDWTDVCQRCGEMPDGSSTPTPPYIVGEFIRIPIRVATPLVYAFTAPELGLFGLVVAAILAIPALICASYAYAGVKFRREKNIEYTKSIEDSRERLKNPERYAGDHAGIEKHIKSSLGYIKEGRKWIRRNWVTVILSFLPIINAVIILLTY